MPKKRVLPYIILGLLKNNGEMTGAEITAEFENEIGEFWQTTHSQIYPELKRMVADEWVLLEPDAVDKKKKWYHLLPSGQAALAQWLATPLTTTTDDEFPLRLFFLQHRDEPLLQSLITQELTLHRDKLEHLNQRLTTLFSNPQTQIDNYGHHLILKRAIERETNNIHWLESTLQELQA